MSGMAVILKNSIATTHNEVIDRINSGFATAEYVKCAIKTLTCIAECARMDAKNRKSMSDYEVSQIEQMVYSAQENIENVFYIATGE